MLKEEFFDPKSQVIHEMHKKNRYYKCNELIIGYYINYLDIDECEFLNQIEFLFS